MGTTAKFKPQLDGNLVESQAKERSLKKGFKLAFKNIKIKGFKIY